MVVCMEVFYRVSDTRMGGASRGDAEEASAITRGPFPGMHDRFRLYHTARRRDCFRRRLTPSKALRCKPVVALHWLTDWVKND